MHCLASRITHIWRVERYLVEDREPSSVRASKSQMDMRFPLFFKDLDKVALSMKFPERWTGVLRLVH